MLLHTTQTLPKPGPGCRIFLDGKSHSAIGGGCLPPWQLFTSSRLRHFAFCHQFAPDTCTWPPAWAHQDHPVVIIVPPCSPAAVWMCKGAEPLPHCKVQQGLSVLFAKWNSEINKSHLMAESHISTEIIIGANCQALHCAIKRNS